LCSATRVRPSFDVELLTRDRRSGFSTPSDVFCRSGVGVSHIVRRLSSRAVYLSCTAFCSVAGCTLSLIVVDFSVAADSGGF